MRRKKVEGKPMDPLFPRLHINEAADKGGPKPPPRNKMGLCEKLNAPSQNPTFNSGSVVLLPLPPNNSRSSCSVSKASSSHVGSSKQKILLHGSSQLAEKYHSSCSSKGLNSNISMTNSDAQLSGRPTNYQNPFVSENLTTAPESNLSHLSYCSSKRAANETDPTFPSFIQSATTLSQENNLQLDKERLTTFSSSEKLLNASVNQPKERSMDFPDKNCKLSENTGAQVEKTVVLPSIGDDKVPAPSLTGNKISELDTEALQSLAKPLQDCRVPQETAERFKRKRYPSEMQDSVLSVGDKNEIKIKAIKKRSDDKACERQMQLGNAGEKLEISETFGADSVPGLDLSPDEIVGVIGQRLFWKARNAIVYQQRVFAMQIFELHRLVKVQRLIAKSPEVLRENDTNLNKPPIKFPNIDKLLYMTSLDPSRLLAKPNLNMGTGNGPEPVSLKRPPTTKSFDKEHLSRQPSPSPSLSLTPSSILTDSKLANILYPPPPGNQWLVPVKSPSEGLIYKPFTGPCPPPVSIAGSVYGNCGPLSVNSNSRTAYCIPAPNLNGIGNFPGGQSYFLPFAMPLLNATGSNLEIERMIAGADNKQSSVFESIFSDSSCNVQSKCNELTASDSGKILHGYCKGSVMQDSSGISLAGDAALSLFPTAPLSKEQPNEQRVQVIKAVPRNPKSAPESAARIFQSIQEERKRT